MMPTAIWSSCIYVEGLVAFLWGHAEIKLLLAKSYEIGDDGKTYTFRAARWRDLPEWRAPLTAQDVVWS